MTATRKEERIRRLSAVFDEMSRLQFAIVDALEIEPDGEMHHDLECLRWFLHNIGGAITCTAPIGSLRFARYWFE